MIRKIVLATSTFVLINFSSLEAERYIISPITPPSQVVLDFDSSSCNDRCLESLYSSNRLFSFLAKYYPTDNARLRSLFQIASEKVGIEIDDGGSRGGGEFRLALLMPHKMVGRYSVASSDTILSYLVTREIDFDFRVFDSVDETASNLQRVYRDIERAGYDFVIAILTVNGTRTLLSNSYISLPLYIPTVNVKQLSDVSLPRKVFFGGIDYEEQMRMIVRGSGDHSLISYSDSGHIGGFLSNLLRGMVGDQVRDETVDSQLAANFKPMISKHKDILPNSVVILNTSIIKSGLVMPQITASDSSPIMYLSTQINYNQSLLTLTQPRDTSYFYVVNSIGKVNKDLLEYSSLFSSDLSYDWVNYATAIGVELFLDMRSSRLDKYFGEIIEGNQVMYNNRFYKTDGYRFIPN